MRIRWLLVVAVAVTAAGCGGNKNRIIRKLAASDLSCSEGQVRLSTVSKSQAQYRADGCGRHALYTFARGDGALRISPIEGAVTTGPGYLPPPPGNPPPSGTATPPGSPPPPPPPPAP